MKWRLENAGFFRLARRERFSWRGLDSSVPPLTGTTGQRGQTEINQCFRNFFGRCWRQQGFFFAVALCFTFCLSALSGQAAITQSSQADQLNRKANSPTSELDAREFSSRRKFRSGVRREMAENAARVDVELRAFEQAAQLLTKQPDVQFAGDAQGIGPTEIVPLNGLALSLFSTRVTAIGAEGFPPHLQAVIHIKLVEPANLRLSLQNALQRREALELYAAVLDERKKLLKRYDALAEVLLPLQLSTDGGKEELHALESTVNEMKALDIYLSLLPTYAQSWTDPQRAKDILTQAKEMGPENPLILTGLAEALLQMDKPVQALEHIGRALALSASLACAHDVKGAILLRQRLPALAAESFSQAIALSPKNSTYYMHRASAYLVQEEEFRMCEDFQQACGLGVCDGLQWARSVNRCMALKP